MESAPLERSLLFYTIILLLTLLLGACSPSPEGGETSSPEGAGPESSPAPLSSASSAEQSSGEQSSSQSSAQESSGTSLGKPRYSGPLVRVSLKLSYPSVVAAGYAMDSLATDPKAQAYRAELEEKQRALLQQIEAHCGEAITLHWQITLNADVISIEVREAALEWIRSLPEVLEAEKENQNETNH